jgi:hypothetical protein
VFAGDFTKRAETIVKQDEEGAVLRVMEYVQQHKGDYASILTTIQQSHVSMDPRVQQAMQDALRARVCVVVLTLVLSICFLFDLLCL